MKAFFLSVAVFSLLSFSPRAMGGGWGLQGGVSIAQSKIEPSSGITFLNRTGAAGGLFVDLSLTSWLSIGPEVLYVQKGSKISIFGIEASYKFDYVDVPLLLKIRIGGQTVGLTLFGGVAYGFLVSAKTEVLGATNDVNGQLKKNDLSGHFGGSLGFMMGKKAELFLSARYIMGLQDIDGDGDASDSTKNNAIASMMGLKFHLGKN